MDGIKSDLQIEELREKINKLKSETAENLAEAEAGQIPKLMKSAEFKAIKAAANIAENVTIDSNGNVKSGTVPLDDKGSLGILVNLQGALKDWGQGSEKYKKVTDRLVTNKVEDIISKYPMKYKPQGSNTIKTKVIGLKKAKQIIASGNVAQIEGLKFMLNESGFGRSEIESIIEVLK